MELNSIVSDSEVGAAIKRRRNELLWSLEKLGNLVDVSGPQMLRYESGANSLTLGKFQEIAFALSVPISYFIPDGPSQKAANSNECNNLVKGMEVMVTDFERIAAQKGEKSGVPALQLGNYKKLTPILLVDDDESVLRITKLLLEGEGYRNLHLILDSRSVIPFLREEEVAMIIMDLKMPHIMGNELLPTIKHDFPKIPVIIMTAIGDMDIAEDCKRLGAFDFLVKPVDPATLISAIERTMKN